jgi:hypothetical protein
MTFNNQSSHFIEFQAGTHLLTAPGSTSLSCTAFNSAVVTNQVSNQLWRLESTGTFGIYRIRNERHGTFLTATSAMAVTLAARNTANNSQNWRIVRLTNGRMTIESVAHPSRFLTRSTATGTALILENTTVGGNRREWRIRPLTLNVDVLFDRGYVTRQNSVNSSYYRTRLNTILHTSTGGNRNITNAFMQDFGISVNFVNVSSRNMPFQSFLYQGNRCNQRDNMDRICCTGATGTGCMTGSHHKNSQMMVRNLPNGRISNFNSTRINLLFTGHITCFTRTNGVHQVSPAAPWGLASFYSEAAAFVAHTASNLLYRDYRAIVMHEILHLFGVRDHNISGCLMSSTLWNPVVAERTIRDNLTTSQDTQRTINAEKHRFFHHGR